MGTGRRRMHFFLILFFLSRTHFFTPLAFGNGTSRPRPTAHPGLCLEKAPLASALLQGLQPPVPCVPALHPAAGAALRCSFPEPLPLPSALLSLIIAPLPRRSSPLLPSFHVLLAFPSVCPSLFPCKRF